MIGPASTPVPIQNAQRLPGLTCSRILKNSDDLSNRHPLAWVDSPTSLDRPPQTVRNLGVIGSCWAISLPHGHDRSDFTLASERDLPSQCLVVGRFV